MITASDWLVTGLLRASLGLSILAVAVGLSVRLLRVRSPRAEQWAWLLVLVQGVIVVPLHVSIPETWRTRTPVADTGPTEPPAVADASIESAASETTEPGEPARPPDGRANGPKDSAVVLPVVASPAPTQPLITASDAALIVWLVGLSTLLGIGLVRYLAFVMRVRGARLAPHDWETEWRRTLDEGSVRSSIPIVVTQDEGPALCLIPEGYRLVVPEALWGSLDPAERTSILRHERTHFVRGDLVMTLLARCLGAI